MVCCLDLVTPYFLFGFCLMSWCVTINIEASLESLFHEMGTFWQTLLPRIVCPIVKATLDWGALVTPICAPKSHELKDPFGFWISFFEGGHGLTKSRSSLYRAHLVFEALEGKRPNNHDKLGNLWTTWAFYFIVLQMLSKPSKEQTPAKSGS